MQDKLYILRKLAVVTICILVFFVVGLSVVTCQSKEVVVNYYGKDIYIKTMSNTIEGMLMQNNIYIDDTAIVYPSRDSFIKDNMQIMIYSENTTATINLNEYKELAANKHTEKYFVESQVIEFEVVEMSNAEKPRGLVATTQNGEAGLKEVTYVKTYVNGKEVELNVLDEDIIKEPINQVIEIGTNLHNVSRGNTSRITAKDLAVDSSFKLYNINLSSDLQRYAYNMCKKYGVNYETFLALMYTESKYNPNAVSSTNDYGICQINSSNHAYLRNVLGVTDFFNPYENIKAGVYWLARYYNSWGYMKDSPEYEYNVLNSYNFGTGAYYRYLDNGNSPYSWHYAKKIISVKNDLIKNGGI